MSVIKVSSLFKKCATCHKVMNVNSLRIISIPGFSMQVCTSCRNVEGFHTKLTKYFGKPMHDAYAK